MGKRIFYVEDEANIGSTLKDRLESEGFEITWLTNEAAALEILARSEKYDLALLDIGLPDGDGWTIAEKIRSATPEVPIIFLTAWGTPEDRIRGLEAGAEDYILKPFHTRELLLRIQNVLKRSLIFRSMGSGIPNVQEPWILIGEALVSFTRFEVKAGTKIQRLSHKECALLKLLYEKRGGVVSRDEILETIWGEDEYPTPRTVDNFILRLRKWIEADGGAEWIQSVRGVGYQLSSHKGEKK